MFVSGGLLPSNKSNFPEFWALGSQKVVSHHVVFCRVGRRRPPRKRLCAMIAPGSVQEHPTEGTYNLPWNLNQQTDRRKSTERENKTKDRPLPLGNPRGLTQIAVHRSHEHRSIIPLPRCSFGHLSADDGEINTSKDPSWKAL